MFEAPNIRVPKPSFNRNFLSPNKSQPTPWERILSRSELCTVSFLWRVPDHTKRVCQTQIMLKNMEASDHAFTNPHPHPHPHHHHHHHHHHQYITIHKYHKIKTIPTTWVEPTHVIIDYISSLSKQSQVHRLPPVTKTEIGSFWTWLKFPPVVF